MNDLTKYPEVDTFEQKRQLTTDEMETPNS